MNLEEGGWEDLKGQRRALKDGSRGLWDGCAGRAPPRLSRGSVSAVTHLPSWQRGVSGAEK